MGKEIIQKSIQEICKQIYNTKNVAEGQIMIDPAEIAKEIESDFNNPDFETVVKKILIKHINKEHELNLGAGLDLIQLKEFPTVTYKDENLIEYRIVVGYTVTYNPHTHKNANPKAIFEPLSTDKWFPVIR